MSIIHKTNIVKDDLLLFYDAGNVKSYPGSGNTIFDLTTNKINGTLNSPVYNSANGGEIIFDGVNDYIDISPTRFNLTALTVSLWFSCTNFSSVYTRLVHKADASGATTGFAITVAGVANKLNVVYQPNYTMSGEIVKRTLSTLSTNKYYNVVLTHENLTLLVYINGVNDTDVPGGPEYAFAATGNNFSIGKRAGESLQWFQGRMSDLKIYDRALTPIEIKQNFDATRSRYNV